MNKEIPCYIFRGGTSKGVFLLEKDIPVPGEKRDALLLRIMGSPDPTQIDGLGGATSVTSKMAIIAPSKREDADVDYTFAQVAIDKPVVDYKGNCGNISSAVGPFSIECGLVKASSPFTVVRVFNTNTGKILEEKVETPERRVNYEGSFSISGVPGTAAPVQLIFKKPSGTITDRLLPTGNATDELVIPDFGKVVVSLVDSSNPLVFVKAEDIGMKGSELPRQIDGDEKLLELLEKIRGVAAQKLGLVEDYRESPWKSPAVPKMTVVSPAIDYVSSSGKLVKASEVDIVARMMSMQKAHRTYAMTGAMCTASAAAVPGTVVNQAIKPATDTRHLHIGHPGGVIETGVECRAQSDGSVLIESAWGYRTARLLLKGTVYC